MIGKCAKQEVIAVIENNGQYWIGSNWCLTPQDECPRGDMPSGEGYNMCHDTCRINGHAEVEACNKAGDNADGGTLYLVGHSYCCDDCKEVMAAHEIKEIVIGRLPWEDLIE
jgi:hypothetical protein